MDNGWPRFVAKGKTYFEPSSRTRAQSWISSAASDTPTRSTSWPGFADFEISVAACPETHPEATSSQFDLENLKRKLDAGASRAITQFFFDTELFLGFRDRVRRAGIDAPLTPGILPVTNHGQVARFARMCGAGVPSWLTRIFESLENDPEARKLVAEMVAGEQCRILTAGSVSDFHLYTLNRANLTFAICHMLGLRDAAAGSSP